MTPFSKWMVIEDDPKKLAYTIKKYINNDNYKRSIVENVYDWAKTQTWEKLTDDYYKLWGIEK